MMEALIVAILGILAFGVRDLIIRAQALAERMDEVDYPEEDAS
jgi:hypothetical protein